MTRLASLALALLLAGGSALAEDIPAGMATSARQEAYLKPLALEQHWSPAENLEPFDVALITQARSSIDMAAYLVTDWQLQDDLVLAARRGVAVRLVLDASEFQRRRQGQRRPGAHAPENDVSRRRCAALRRGQFQSKRADRAGERPRHCSRVWRVRPVRGDVRAALGHGIKLGKGGTPPATGVRPSGKRVWRYKA